MKLHILFFIAVAFIFIIVYFTGCATQDALRERIQNDHPDCFVMEDLSLECPDPFQSNAGFGSEIINQKVKKPGKKK